MVFLVVFCFLSLLLECAVSRRKKEGEEGKGREGEGRCGKCGKGNCGDLCGEICASHMSW